MGSERMNADSEQNLRIRDLENKVNSLEIQLTKILTTVEGTQKLGKLLFVAVCAVFGLDVAPMLSGGV
jgi:hypothetical protein